MKKVILCGVPHHSNLGDHAIYIAEKELIKEKFPEYELQIVDEVFAEKCVKRIKTYIADEDILFLQGGGNLGNQYKVQESGRRSIIENFPNNKIVLFPQTMYFSNDENGKEELKKTKQIYNSHNNLYLMAREEITYLQMKEYFPNAKVFFTPDIVTILNETKEPLKREGALFLVRNDVEKNIENQYLEEIEKMCIERNMNTIYSDNDKGGVIHELIKKDKVYEMLELFKKSQLVVTDRLHGMIFAVITGTPCIVFGNYNHKVEKSYEWFKELPYIHFVAEHEEIKNLDNEIERLLNLDAQKYNNDYSKKIFDKVFEEIEEN